MSVTLAEVVTLYDKNASDIPAMLRACADRIESGEVPIRSMMAVAIDPEDGIGVFGWGRIEGCNEAVGILYRGIHDLLSGGEE